MTTPDEETGHVEEVRCVCRSKRLLAVTGVDPKTKSPYVHVKAMRNGQPYTEVVVKGGSTSILCRSCGRWFTIRIAQSQVWTSEAQKPAVIPD